MLSLTRQCLWKGRSLSNNHGSGRGGSKGRSFSRTFLSFYWREALCSLFCSFAGSGVWAKGLVWIPRSTTLCSPKGCSEANIVWCLGSMSICGDVQPVSTRSFVTVSNLQDGFHYQTTTKG